jgi:Protein of unknown function (DUF1569)
MAEIDDAVAGNRTAVAELLDAADRAGAVWTVPRASGKWAPSQVVEHVARTLEESANVVAGAPSRFPTMPALVRPLIRGLFFTRVLKKKAFPTVKTNPAMDPADGPSTPDLARARLETAVERFNQECLACAAGSGMVASTVFGKVGVVDFARFQEIHTRHHCRQMPGAARQG